MSEDSKKKHIMETPEKDDIQLILWGVFGVLILMIFIILFLSNDSYHSEQERNTLYDFTPNTSSYSSDKTYSEKRDPNERILRKMYDDNNIQYDDRMIREDLRAIKKLQEDFD